MDIGARRTTSHDDIDDEPLEETEPEEGERELLYANVAEFVTEHLAYQYRRDTDLAGRPGHHLHLVRPMVAPRRSRQPPHRPVAGLGEPAHRSHHRAGRVVAGLRRPHHAGALR
jgi:hypothetical protein